MPDTKTVSLRIELARQATRSSPAATLVFHSAPSACPAAALKRKVPPLLGESLWAETDVAVAKRSVISTGSVETAQLLAGPRFRR
jgi:hypothetical protein